MEKLERKFQKKKNCALLLLFGESDSYLIGLFYTLIMLNCMETSPILLPATYLI
jgi:hypothetical protein